MSPAVKRYRKKPVIIEGMQVDFHDNESIDAIMKWAGDKVKFFNFDPSVNHFYACKVETLGGNMSAFQGYWIIKGVKGEFYLCEPEIFDMTYEVVTDE